MVGRSLFGKLVFVLIFMPSEAESTLLDASICLHVMTLRGVVCSMMLVLADVMAYERHCGCLCLLAQCFYIERFAYNLNHFSLLALSVVFVCSS